MRNEYTKQITDLQAEIIEMGTLVETAIAKSISSLSKNNAIIANEVITHDCLIDTKEKEIASSCVTITLLQQPIATDLRIITAATRIISDMERIGDHATDISQIVIEISSFDYFPYIDKILKMSEIAIKMLNCSLESYIKQDISIVDTVRSLDDSVDKLFNDVKDEMSYMIINHASKGKYAIELVMIAKYIERIADHSVNIANWTEFCKTGFYKKSKII